MTSHGSWREVLLDQGGEYFPLCVRKAAPKVSKQVEACDVTGQAVAKGR
ncbi:MAG: hypothetical protein ACOY0T_27170 [Myxococcota bacterium]